MPPYLIWVSVSAQGAFIQHYKVYLMRCDLHNDLVRLRPSKIAVQIRLRGIYLVSLYDFILFFHQFSHPQHSVGNTAPAVQFLSPQGTCNIIEIQTKIELLLNSIVPECPTVSNMLTIM